MAVFIAVLLISLLVSTLTTTGVIRAAKAFNLFDAPGVRKLHRNAIPRLGGVAIVVACSLVTAPFVVWGGSLAERFPAGTIAVSSLDSMERPLVALCVASLFMFLVGLIDDLCGLRARTKLIAQLAAGLILCGFGVRIEEFSLGSSLMIRLGWLSWPFSLLWIVGVTNALNLIDGLDGLAGGIAVVAGIVTAIVAIHVGQWMTLPRWRPAA